MGSLRLWFFLIFTSAVLYSRAHVMSLENPRVVSKITTLPSQVSLLGEGPYFSETEQALYYVDTYAGEVVRLDVVIGSETKIHIGGLVSMIIPYSGEPGKFILASGNRLLTLDWQTKQTELIIELNPDESFNDAKCDPRGRLIIGTILEPNGTVVPKGGSLYRLDGNVLTRIAQGFTISNGMSWSNDAEHKDFYFNDSEGLVYHFDYNVTDGSLTNKRVLIDVATHEDFVAGEVPDGQAMDQFGFIWVAMWNGRRVVKINPATARVVDEVRFPRVQIPSSLAFGRYKGEFGIYVTTASIGIPPEDLLDDGKLHHVSFQGGEIQGFNPNAKAAA